MKNPFVSTLRGAFCVVIAVSAISVTHADEAPAATEKKIPPGILKKYDANKDGVLDESEKAAWEASNAKQKEAMESKRLKKYDANKDGTLDESEIAAEKASKEEAAAKRKANAEEKKANAEKKKAEAAKKKADAEAAAAAEATPTE